MKPRILANALLFLLTAIQLASQPTVPSGAIRGIVIDEHSEPVAGADVYFDRGPDEVVGGLIRYVQSDSTGRFFIAFLKPGHYRVFAKKEADAYPDSSSEIYSRGTIPIVEVSPASPTADARVQIGPKAATVVLSISDAATGDPLSGSVRIWRWTGAGFLSTTVLPLDKILVPASTEVGLEISSPGYQTWHYSGPTGQEAPLNLMSGSTLKVDVKLQPVPK